MIVYHGTTLSSAINIYNNGIDLNKSKEYLDFGRGFYTTTDFFIAKNMAIKVSVQESLRKNIKKVFPAVVTFIYKESHFMNCRKFEYENIEWAKFIIANRVTSAIAYELRLNNRNEEWNYDIVIGGIADGNIAGIASDLRFGKIKPKDYILKLTDFLKDNGSSYGTQITFRTKKSLSCIKCIKYDTIPYEEMRWK